MKVAIVHDWLVNYGGAERVVEALLSIFPDADIFTLVYDEKKIGRVFKKEKVKTSFLQKIPFSTRLYTKMLAFMPLAFESFDFSSYDLVISSSSSCAKGVITPPFVPHIAYIHSPMRYAWDLYFEYKKNSGFLTRLFMTRLMPRIREWDFISSQRIDLIVANSKYIARRIEKYWRREAFVVHPPVDTARLVPSKSACEDFFVVFSRFVPYKRIDLAIEACAKSGRHLVVIGGGAQEKELKLLAEKWKQKNGAKIEFTGRISDEEVKAFLQKCRALIFCAEEDFGIIPVEAQACGRPVVAFGRGGATETVVDGKTGVLFKEQTVDSLCAALEKFDKLFEEGAFLPSEIALHAQKFSTERFVLQMKNQINSLLEKFNQ